VIFFPVVLSLLLSDVFADHGVSTVRAIHRVRVFDDTSCVVTRAAVASANRDSDACVVFFSSLDLVQSIQRVT